jgi:hypothetical protein
VAGDVAAIAVRGRWLKHTFPGSLALPEREPPPDNRWQRGDIVDALYLADSEESVWAEWRSTPRSSDVRRLSQICGPICGPPDL